jgi:phage terminase, large subunit, PBSX family|nr:MAG TPA: large terminase [Caudoviricetes sp.]
MNSVYTPKQRELLRLWQTNKLNRINLLSGSVRSGKTWISLVLWAFWVATMPKEKNYLMTAKSLTTLKRNVLDLLTELVGEKNFTFSIAQKQALLFGRKIYLEGANDARAESKIRGMTLQGAYCDELTLYGENFFTMMLSRLSEPNAKLFATTNPDTPMHWLNKKYIERGHELNMLLMTFLIDDNTFLDPNYVEELKKEYVGVFYDRFIRGLWVVAEGLVYPRFSKADNVTEDIPESGTYYISIDYGTLNPFSAGLWCVSDGKAVRIKEYYHSGRDTKRQLTDEEYHAALEKLIQYTDSEGILQEYEIDRVVIDPSAASFIACMRRHGKFRVKHAVNTVIDGIRNVTSMLNSKRLFIHSSCKDSIKEFGLYSWDDKAQEDKVIKENDHAMDDIRYFVNTILVKEFKWLDWR